MLFALDCVSDQDAEEFVESPSMTHKLPEWSLSVLVGVRKGSFETIWMMYEIRLSRRRPEDEG